MCRKNNATATYTKNMIDAALGALIALGCGYQVAYGVSPVTCSHLIDGQDSEAAGNAVQVCAKFFHHLVFQATASTIRARP